MAIVAESLSKQFGDTVAVNRLSFAIPDGQIVGLVGPNGAGKTTLLRMLTGVLAPSAGSASIGGFDLLRQALEVKRTVGYAPESSAAFESLSALEFLEIVAQLFGVPLDLAHERIFKLGDLFELDRRVLAERLLGTFSKGMRRKVIISSALLHNPSVIFFDEPLDGLDPSATIAFKTLIRSLADEGRTIVYSSHLLDVVERVCDRVIILDHGVIAMDGSPAQLLANAKSATLERLFAQITGTAEIQGRAAAAAKALIEGGT